MADEKKHKTLLDLLKQKDTISIEAAQHSHEGFLPTVAQFPASPTEKKNPISQKTGSERGRILLFQPTGEKVTVLKERVGQSYKGDWIHEVTTRDGHKFLAMQKQLTDIVK